MNPDGTDAEIIGHGYRNSYEQVVSSMGDLFQSDNDDYSSCRNSYVLEYGSAGYYSLDGQHKWQASKRSGQAIQRAHWRQDNPGTFDTGDVYGAGGPTGVAFYENGSLGKKWEGTYLSCEATRNVVFGYHPKPSGATYSLDRFDFVSTAATASDLNKESEEEAEKEFISALQIWTLDPMVPSTLRTGTMNAQADTALRMNPLQERFTGLLPKISNQCPPP